MIVRMDSRAQTIAIRPLEIKHLFDFAIRLYRANFSTMFLAMAAVQLPLSLLSLPLARKSIEIVNEMKTMQVSGRLPDQAWMMDKLTESIPVLLVALAVPIYQLFIMPLGNLTCARLAMQAALDLPENLNEALRFAVRRYWPTQVALALYLLPLLLLSVVILLFVLASQAAGSETGVLSFSLLGLSLISMGALAMLLLYPRVFAALSGIVQCREEAEGQGILAQGLWYLKRAYALSEGFYMRLVGLLLLMHFAVGFITQGISETTNLLLWLVSKVISGGNLSEEFLDPAGQQDMLVVGLTMIITIVVTLVLVPVWQCLKVLLYVDLRCRKEAFDLHLLLDRQARSKQ
jgi:hypothetical protein